VQFWRFLVLQRHGVSLPGGDFFHGVFPSEDQQQQQQKLLQQQAEKVARIHSSSKRKEKQPKSSFHHHFLWVSEVTLGICREVIFPWCVPIRGPEAAAAAKASAAAGGKGSQNS